ncbi:MAG: S9 family peptidase [Paenibacillaceae bacterium]|nr:S9 family peptidase [Paenibacillaceae bacterium]
MIETERPAASFVRLPDPEPGIAWYEVSYDSQGLRVKALLAVPAAQPAPVVVYCRGGIGSVGMVGPAQLLPFARRGYVVLAPLYRGSGSGVGRDEFGGADRHDVSAAIALARTLPGAAAAAKVALIGFSRGAIMAMQAARTCAEVGAVVVWSGVADLGLTYRERTDLRRMLRRVVGHPGKQPEAYAERSPVAWAGEVDPPVLLIHGTADDNVSAAHARLLGRALDDAGKRYTLSLYDGVGHQFPPPAREAAMREIDAWLRRFMPAQA